MALFLLRSALEREEPVGPVGPRMERDLDEPLAALYMMMECFEEITGWEGEVPEGEPFPDGAMG